MPMFEVTVIPVGVEGPSISRFVSGFRSKRSKASGLPFQLTPMGTCLIASYARLAEVLEKIHQRFKGEGVVRIATTIKVDNRPTRNLLSRGKSGRSQDEY